VHIQSANNTCPKAPVAWGNSWLVFFSVRLSDNHLLAQIGVRVIPDDIFFDELKRVYIKLRGWFR